MRILAAIAIALAVLTAACAPRAAPPPTVTAPRFPQFVLPEVPAELAATAAARNHARAWQYLQAGDFRMADRELGLALKAQPEFYPAEAAAGYVALARNDAGDALARFDRALSARADYVPALIGRGEALLALDRETEAMAAFEGALAANPGLTDLRRRVEILEFQALERDLAAARAAARAGRSDEAIRLFQAAIGASPDSSFLYRELAMVEVQRGDQNAALDHFRRAVELDPADAVSLVQIAGILDARGELAEALDTYDRALAIEPDEAVSERRAALEERIELAKLPEQYHAIETAARINRADLAALVGVRLGAALDLEVREGVVITDVRGSWAERWIMMVARAGVIDAFENHTFQPDAVVTRADLAAAVARVLQQAATTQGRGWEKERVRFEDLAPGHLAYAAASAAVAAGVMRSIDGSFQPSRPVTGAEAVEAVERLRVMTALASRR